MNPLLWLSLVTSLAASAPAHASPNKGPHPIETNSVRSSNAPAWLTSSRVSKVTDKIGTALEWDVRKITLEFFYDQAAFRKAHGLDDSVLAFTVKTQNLVGIGPKVTATDFDQILGHELVHVILYQKYKGAVPGWLEEGLANHTVKYGKVDYAWLASLPERDVTSLVHPFSAGGRLGVGGPRYAYQASQALMEMIATRCDVKDLVTMSVGKKLESYLPTLCEIKDLNGDFRKWIQKKAGKKPGSKARPT
jgi:hypothetical protein